MWITTASRTMFLSRNNFGLNSVHFAKCIALAKKGPAALELDFKRIDLRLIVRKIAKRGLPCLSDGTGVFSVTYTTGG